MKMTRATRQIRPARIPNQESSAPIRVRSPLDSVFAFLCANARKFASRAGAAQFHKRLAHNHLPIGTRDPLQPPTNAGSCSNPRT